MEESLAVAEARSTLAQTLVEAGNITHAMLIKNKARKKDVERMLHNAEADYQAARTRLGGLMGLRTEANNWQIAQPLPSVPNTLELPEGTASKAEKASLMLATARAQSDAIAQRYRLSTPGIFIGASEVGVTAERDDGAWEVGPSVAFPLPLFDQGQARRAEGRALLSQAEDLYAQQQTNIANRAWQLSLGATNAYQIAHMLETQRLPLAQNAQAEAQRRYNAMQLDLFDLMDGKDALINVRLERVKALAAY